MQLGRRGDLPGETDRERSAIVCVCVCGRGKLRTADRGIALNLGATPPADDLCFDAYPKGVGVGAGYGLGSGDEAGIAPTPFEPRSLLVSFFVALYVCRLD